MFLGEKQAKANPRMLILSQVSPRFTQRGLALPVTGNGH
jgi:hypothetical protein